MRVILGHVNADFDVLASMVGAWKLYPDALMVFPGSQEKTVRDYLATHSNISFPFYKAKDIDIEKVTELILVDTRFSNRIGIFKDLLNKNDVRVVAYDHHPLDQGDIKAHELHQENIGSTATILVKEIKAKNIKLTPDEATILAIGIYEDTGSLTYITVRKDDFDAVGYLVEHGASLVNIPSILKIDLTKDQLPLFADILKNMEYHVFEGIQVGISQLISESYMGELALFIHKLRDIGHIPAIFILVKLKDRIQIVARSQTLAVNLNQILGSIGGGGHPSAASAVVHDKSLDEVKQWLYEQLEKDVEPLLRAKDIMTSPVMTLSPDSRVDDVRKIYLRYHHNAYPVIKGKELIGLITSMDVGRAFHLGYAKEPIEKFMHKDFHSVDSYASFRQVRALISRPEIPLLPVTESSGRLVGVITRSDLLRVSQQIEVNYDHSMTLSENTIQNARLKTLNLTDLLNANVAPHILFLLKKAGDVGDSLGYKVYIVGGFVRDLILNEPNYDLDLVIEGDGINFATQLADLLNGNIKSHKRFNTAIVTTPEHFRIDIATARTEFYEYPAALPVVESSSIKHDLYRRDFTINAMAIRLNPCEFGQLHDYFNGSADLRHGRIRVLHNLSFVEDPTRIFRAIRFEQRYGFKMDKQTRHNLSNALDLDIFSKLGNERTREELFQILSEKKPWLAVKRMSDLNVLKTLHPKLKLLAGMDSIFDSIDSSIELMKTYTIQKIDRYEVYLLALIQSLNIDETRDFCYRLSILGKISKDCIQLKRILYKVSFQNSETPELLHQYLKEASPSVITYLMSYFNNSDISSNPILKYLDLLKKRTIRVNGDDLIKIGYHSGPEFKVMLENLQAVSLRQQFDKKEDEIKWIINEYPNTSKQIADDEHGQA